MKEPNKGNRIVFIGRFNSSEDLSGPEKVSKRIFAMASESYDTAFIQYFFDGRKYGLFKKLFGLEESLLSGSVKIHTAGLVRLFILLIKLKPSFIHIITFERFAIVAVYYSRIWKKARVLYNAHGIIIHEDNKIKKEESHYARRNRHAEKMFLDSAWKIIFPSESAVLYCQQYYNFDERKSVIISSGIDEVFHKFSSASVRNGIVVLSGGLLHESTRSFLRKYLEGLKGNVHLFIIGDKTYFSDLARPGIFMFERMHGAELAKLYENKDIFLSLNDYDTFSMATAEAMTAGLIPIVTKQTGISSMVFNDVNGYVIDYNDVEMLGTKIDKLRSMNPVTKEIMRNNAKSIFHKLSWNKVFEKYDEIYRAGEKKAELEIALHSPK